MMPFVWLAAATLIGVYIYNYYRCFARNLAAAKQSGLPYVVAPVYGFNRFWLVTHRLWIPLLEKLPKSWTDPWLQFLDPEWTWLLRREPFKAIGSDIFIVCSPGKNALFVADPEATTQIVTRRNDFPKPIEIYGSVDLFGKNVVSTEGSIWRHHRKITSPPFTEKNNHLVWQESLHQAQSMMASLVGKNSEGKGTVTDIAAATMRLSLHIISRAGFGRRLLWPHEELEENGQAGVVPEGHTMTYKDALSTLLENIIAVMLLPKWFLLNSPIKQNKVAYESFTEWGKYMREMYLEKRAEVQAGEKREGMDLMGALVSGAGIKPDQDPEKADKQLLTDDEILGNAFVFILAGHETTANTLHFAMLYLAMNWSTQKLLQDDLDEIFGDRPIDQWDYEQDVPKLFGGMCGAVMNEELRLIPPVVGIPKCTLKDSPQPLTLSGRRVIVPEGTAVTLITVASHRNPKHWPTLCGPNASEAEIEKDLASWKPQRWILDPSKSNSTAAQKHAQQNAHSDSEEDIGGPQSSDTSSHLFSPERGAFIPFSEGYRACLGRRFAQVEVLAVLAAIFREYSVELDLDKYASDEELAAMSEASRRSTWDKAKSTAENLLQHGMGTIITIQMRTGKVPVKFVKRGSEKYKYD
ncbi:cytochrome P450 [Aureobasidium pullulans]|uniref:Cytochrome P450 n=1 Tax=Aureobasidium pullulans TaxID=5580 RepID=A0A4T0B9N9_AURPU|nr:cytochrome P450 [Aureobasidium pullulans]THX04869.1 cytochrome P450 [Aureobasidium pullulans]TIA29978.1 cytochrome P450 [Aureobasidium pullulans]